MSAEAPGSPGAVAAALAEATAAGEPVRVRGGGTRSRRGLPAPGPVRELSTLGLRRVVAYEPADLTVTVEAGLRAEELEALAGERGQRWPQADVRPGSTVGGILATGASGRGRLRHGPVRDSLLEVVLATGDGRLVRGGGRTVKGVAGYDLPRLAVGSHGTLGVIVQATLKLWPVPRAAGWFGLEGPLGERLAAARALLSSAARPAAVLLRPGALEVLLEGPREDVAPPPGMAPRAGAPAGPAGRGLVEAGVPPPRVADLAEALEAGGADYEARLGVGTVLAAVGSAAEVAFVRERALALGGHAVVVDGPDDLRADPWGPPPPGLAVMRRLREAFDPGGVINPGLAVGAS